MSLLKQQLDSNIKASNNYWLIIAAGLLFIILSLLYLA